MGKPISNYISPMLKTDYPVYFELWGDKFKSMASNKHYIKTKQGEKEITKKSNTLMDALIGGNFITKDQYLA